MSGVSNDLGEVYLGDGEEVRPPRDNMVVLTNSDQSSDMDESEVQLVTRRSLLVKWVLGI